MYDQLPPHVAKRLLGKVVEKIDLDSDGFVSREELLEWIERLNKRWVTPQSKPTLIVLSLFCCVQIFAVSRKIHENTDFRWNHYNLKNEEKISWDDYLLNSWGRDAKEGIGLDEISDPDRGWTLEFVIGELSNVFIYILTPVLFCCCQ